MVRTIIIDDEQHCIDKLEQLMKCSEITFKLLRSYTSFDDALNETDNFNIDLLFLDIHVHDELGFDFLKKLGDFHFDVIFTTAYSKYAVRAFKFSAIDYLLKPICEDDFEASARRIQEKMNQKSIDKNLEILLHNLQKQDPHKKISLPTLEGFVFVEIQEIIRCQADVNYTHFYLMGNQRITVSKSLKHYEELLSDCNFFRVHNSHLINLNYIKKYTRGKGGYVTMADNSQIQVSTRRKEQFLRNL